MWWVVVGEKKEVEEVRERAETESAHSERRNGSDETL